MTSSKMSKCCIKNNSADNFIVKIGHVGSLEPAIDLGCYTLFLPFVSDYLILLLRTHSVVIHHLWH